MKQALLLLLLLSSTLSAVTVTGIVYNADGSPAQGDVIIQWPTFTSGSQLVMAGSRTYRLSSTGSLSVNLFALDYYTVTYRLNLGTPTRVAWVVPASPTTTTIIAVQNILPPAGLPASGITQINGLTPSSQTITSGTAGTNFNVSSASSTHTINCPTASATVRGCLASADFITFSAGGDPPLGGDLSGTASAATVAKINGVALGSTTATSANVLIANGTQWVTRTISGDVTITGTGVATVAGTSLATPSTIMKRDGVGGSATTAFSVTTLSVIPIIDIAGISVRRGIAGQVNGIQAWATEGGSILSQINPDGTFSSSALHKARKNSTGSVFTRSRYNFIEGTNVTLTVGDDAGNDEVDITIAAAGGGGGSGGGAVQTFSAGATSVTVTHTLGAGVVIDCFIGTAPDYVLWLPNTVQRNPTTTVFGFTAASGDGDCVVGSGSPVGITTINSQSMAAATTFAVGTTGSDFAIVATTSTVTFNLPNAGASARGVVSTGAQGFVGTKTFTRVALDGTILDPGCPGGQYSVYATSEDPSYLKSCINGASNRLGNVTSIVSPTIDWFPQWSTTGSVTDLKAGKAGATAATADTVALRDSSGNLTATNFLGAKYQTVMDEGAALTQRATINFSGSSMACVDDAGNSRTNCIFAIPINYSFIQDEGSTLTQRNTVNFLGAGVACVDSPGAGRTDCTITSGGGGGNVSSGSASTVDYLVNWANGVGTLVGAGVCVSVTTITGECILRRDSVGRVTSQFLDKGGESHNVRAYGAVGDCSTNDAAAIQAAIDAAQNSTSGSTKVVLEGSCYAFSTQLTIGNGSANTESTKRPIIIEGQGAGTDSSTNRKGTTILKWTGSATTTMLKIQGPMNPGPKLRDLTFDGGGVANITGIEQNNVSHSQWDNVTIYRTKLGVFMTANSVAPFPYANCENLYFNLVVSEVSSGGSGINMDGNDVGDPYAAGPPIGVGNGANSCSNFYYSPSIWHDPYSSTAYGVRLAYADSNTFYSPNFYAAMDAAGVSKGGVFFDSAALSVPHQMFPTANVIHRGASHQGWSGTTGTGQNQFTDKLGGDCSRQCEPTTSITSGLKPTITNVGGAIENYSSINMINGGTTATFYEVKDLAGTVLQSIKRTPSSYMEITSFSDIVFTTSEPVYGKLRVFSGTSQPYACQSGRHGTLWLDVATNPSTLKICGANSGGTLVWGTVTATF